jgi:hypothetical protein
VVRCLLSHLLSALKDFISSATKYIGQCHVAECPLITAEALVVDESGNRLFQPAGKLMGELVHVDCTSSSSSAVKSASDLPPKVVPAAGARVPTRGGAVSMEVILLSGTVRSFQRLPKKILLDMPILRRKQNSCNRSH